MWKPCEVQGRWIERKRNERVNRNNGWGAESESKLENRQQGFHQMMTGSYDDDSQRIK